jgi:short-subunit dehydrogenase
MAAGRVAILGATSTIARALAARYAQEGRDLLLCGRDLPEVEAVARDLALRYGIETDACLLDPAAEDYPQLLWRLDGSAPLAGVVWAIGTMAAAAGQAGAAELRDTTWVNFGAAVAAIEALLPAIDPGGFVVVLSSVAGERGRARNYVYGAAKAALSVYAQGLNQRLAGTGPRVTAVQLGVVDITAVQLGVVDSQMTWGMAGGPHGADPERVALAIAAAVRRRRARVHVPAVWALVMLALRALPEGIFNRLNL